MNLALLQTSLLAALLAAVLAGAAGAVAAVCLAGLPAAARRAGLALAAIALAMPPFLVVNSWLDLFGVNGLLRDWAPMNVYSVAGVAAILAAWLWPVPALALLASWTRLESSQLEVEPLLRGGALARDLLWPAGRRSLALALLLAFVLALNNFSVPAILQVRVLPAAMWIEFNTHLSPASALAMGWPLIVAPLALGLCLGRAGEGHWPRLEGGPSPDLFRRQVGHWGYGMCCVAMAAVAALSVGLPLLQLCLSRRTWLEFGDAFAAGRGALASSWLYAAAAAAIAVLLAVARQARLTWRTGADAARLQRADALLWLPLLAPGIFTGLALIAALNRPGLAWLYLSPAVVILALTIRYLALCWFGVASAFAGADRHLVDAGLLEGPGGWRLLRRIVWPQVSSQVCVVGYGVYLLCLWDVETVLLILPPGGETAAARVFNLLHYGHAGQVNALCLWLLLLALLPLLAWTAWPLARRAAARMAPLWPRGRDAVLLAGVTLAAAGCSPSAENRDSLAQSRLFARVEIVGSRGTGPGEFNKPRSLALDAHDNLYVADMTGRIQKFSPQGRYLLAWQMPETDLGKAKGMCCDKAGSIVVIEPHYQRVNRFSPEGRLLAQWGGHLTNGGPFSLPRAVAVNSRNEAIVSEYTLTERVQVFAPSGSRKLLEFGRAGVAPGEFNRPEGVAADHQDRIYVADSCNHRVQVFSPEGRFLLAFGKAGGGPGQLSYPYDVQVDAAGLVFVCEFGNSRIQVFDASGRSLEILGGPGAAPARLANPWSIALDSKGNLYVADSQNHRVQKFVRREGGFSRVGSGAQTGGAGRPSGVGGALPLRRSSGGMSPPLHGNVASPREGGGQG